MVRCHCRLLGQDIGPFSLDIAKGYFIYILAFAGGIYANMQGLKELSPETTTVVRCVKCCVKDDAWRAFLQLYSLVFAVFDLIFSQSSHICESDPTTLLMFSIHHTVVSSNGRSCLPVAVLLIEHFFMGRGVPSIKSAMALGGVIAGA